MDKDLKSDSKEFTWPPPDAELDALEQLFINDDSGSLPAPHGSTEVAPATPQVDAASHLARRGRFGEPRRTAKRLIVTVLPWVAAMAIGALLGERQVRINRTELVKPEQRTRNKRALTPAPPVTKPMPWLTTPQPPAVATSAPPPTSPTRPRELPVPATMLAPATTPTLVSRSRSTSEAASAKRELTTEPTAMPTGVTREPTMAAPVTTADAALDAATIVAAPAALAPAAPAPATLATAATAPTSTAPTALAALIARAPTTTAAAIPRPVAPSDNVAIRRALQMYEDAYDHLDAHAAAAVWPSLDEPALTRAFEGLKAQRLQFDRCNFTVGYSSATAICSGAARFVRRVGKPDPFIERRNWTFHLTRSVSDPSADWKIESVITSR